LILAAILPPSFGVLPTSTSFFTLVNTALSGPHAFLSANEATSVMLHVPWYCNSDLASLDLSKTLASRTSIDINNTPGNLGTLVMIVMQPLAPSDGSSTSLDLIVEAFFNSLDILVPSPKFIQYSPTPPTQYTQFKSQGLMSIGSNIADGVTSFVKSTIGDGIDMLRSSFLKYTGLHNTNIPTINNRLIMTNRNFPNLVDAPQFFEKLDPFVTTDRIFQRPEFNTFVDEMSISHILSKKQFVGTFKVNAGDQVGRLLWTRPISPFQGGLSADSLTISNNIELFHFLSRGWRGSINIHIQSVMNNKQQVKLRLLQLYNPSLSIGSSYPQYRSILNAPSHLMEFTAGGEVQTVNLPYLCRNNITPCMRDMSSESFFHGQYYIYVAQPLANSSGSPLDINFNIYISVGDDFKYYGYSTELATMFPLIDLPLQTLYEPDSTKAFTSQGIEVMNEPQDQSSILNHSGGSGQTQEYQERLYAPIDIRPYIRRMYKTKAVKVVSSNFVIISLDSLIGDSVVIGQNVTPLQLITSMYYGRHIGLKIKIKNNAAPNLTIRHIPPNYFVDDSTSLLLSCQPFLDPANYFENVNSASFPFPIQELPVVSHIGAGSVQNEYEVIIPNNSFYKFVGSPSVFSTTNPNLSTVGLGHLLIVSEDVVTIEGLSIIYVGASDETRLGFHSIAPLFAPVTTASELLTAYSGNFSTGPTAQPSTIRNKFLYYSRI